MERNLYRIIATAPSAFAFPEHQGVFFNNEIPEDPVVRIAISTVWQDFPPFSVVALPLAIQLTADVWATSIDEVVLFADEVMIGFVDTIAVCANTAIGIPKTQIIFDISPNKNSRQLREYFRPIKYPMVRPVRCQPPDLLFGPLKAFFEARQCAEVGLAIAHYKAALGFFGTAQLIFAFESLCIATEILGEPFVERELSRRSLAKNRKSLKQLAEELGHYSSTEPISNWRNRLYDDIRVRMIFNSDGDLYKKVGKGTNGFEHGTMDPSRIRSIAQETVQPLFSALRRAFFELAGLDTTTMNSLLSWAPVGPEPVRDHIDVTFTSKDESSDWLEGETTMAPTLGISQQIVSAEVVNDYLRVERALHLQPQFGVEGDMSDIRYSISSPYNVVGTARQTTPKSSDPEPT